MQSVPELPECSGVAGYTSEEQPNIVQIPAQLFQTGGILLCTVVVVFPGGRNEIKLMKTQKNVV